jgi:hypothetical protein
MEEDEEVEGVGEEEAAEARLALELMLVVALSIGGAKITSPEWPLVVGGGTMIGTLGGRSGRASICWYGCWCCCCCSAPT